MKKQKIKEETVEQVETPQSAEVPEEMVFETKIVLTGPKGEPINISIEGLEEDGGLVIKTNLPQEFNSNGEFQKQIAAVFLNMLASMRVVMQNPKDESEEESIENAALEEIREDIPGKVIPLGQRGEA